MFSKKERLTQYNKEFNDVYEMRQYLWHEWKYQCIKNPSLPEPRYPPFPLFPDECRDMTCGAKTRTGTPCKRKDLYKNNRCRLHGGPSTGPKTATGKKRSARNGFKADENEPYEEKREC